MSHHFYYEYVEFDFEKFFTIVLLPKREGRFPTVVCRSPYVNKTVQMPEEEIVNEYYNGKKRWLDRGYAVVYQHCRGQGKSTGAFVPYVHEREDGLALREWIREQSFYNGELYLFGGSYTSSLHYATAPFEEDVKGALFEVQDSERYRLWYRNGQMRKGHANWHFGLYKAKCGLNKNFSKRSFSELPLLGLSERVLGDRAEDFEEMLLAERPEDEFWNTRFGGADARDAVTDANIPILLTTGYNDFYVGGVFKMWGKMTEITKVQSAVLVSPYNHGDGYNSEWGVAFPSGKIIEAFGDDFEIDWFDSIRLGKELPYKKGAVNYYRAYDGRWDNDFYQVPTSERAIVLGSDTLAFEYDPKDPPAFREEGAIAEPPLWRDDVLCVYTPPFESDVFVKGQMRASLSLESTAPDTSFYVRISLEKKDYTYVLRHDVTSLSYQLGDYRENSTVLLDFTFDEYAFLIKKGERLRVDISSTDDNGYVVHANKKGKYYLQNETSIAKNKIHLAHSRLYLPIEE